MERGLLWLPLLGIFAWLVWAGWNEYRKLEAYKLWAADYEQAKYDIYAMLGQSSDLIVWGRPTRQGPVQLQQISLLTVQAITLYGGEHGLPNQPTYPKGCEVFLGLTLDTGEAKLIPFTDLELASQWQVRLQSILKSLQSAPDP